MNPCCPPLDVSVTDASEAAWAPLVVFEVGKGGDNEVSVVARRVGLKRFDDA